MSVQYIINLSAGGSIMGVKALVISSAAAPTSVATAVSNSIASDPSSTDCKFSSIYKLDTSDSFVSSLLTPESSPLYSVDSDPNGDYPGPMLSYSVGERSTCSPSTLSVQSTDEEGHLEVGSPIESEVNEMDQLLDDWLFPSAGLPNQMVPDNLGTFDENAILTDADLANISDSVLTGDLFNDEDFIFGDMLLETAVPSPPDSSATTASSASPPFSPDSEVTDYDVSPLPYKREESVESKEDRDDFDMFGEICPQSYMNFGEASPMDDFSEFGLDMDEQPPPAKRRMRATGRPLSDVERRERKKESNRNAAFRYRQKMKAKAADVECDLTAAVADLQRIAASVKESRQTLDLMKNLATEVVSERKRKRP